MGEMEPPDYEYQDEAVSTAQEDLRERDARSARSFFALLSFSVAGVCLLLFIGRSLDMVAGILVLGCALLFGMGGVLLLERNRAASASINRGTQDEMELEGEAEDQEAAEGEPDAFEVLVAEALDSIPAEFRARMENLAILVEDEPDARTLERVGTREGYTLLGLYQGVPLTSQGYPGALLPEHITIYQHTIEAYCHDDPELIREQVRKTVLHEVAHHFGIDHDEMPIWVK